MAELTEQFIPTPPSESIHKSDPSKDLTPKQEEEYDTVYKHFANLDYELGGVENGELMELEKFWLTRECILRFLRASKWVVPTAITRLEATLTWRREFGLYDKLTADYVSPEGETGKQVIFGYDVRSMPALYLIPSRQNTDYPPRQIEYTFFMLERCIDLMGPGVEALALLINFAERSKGPTISTSRTVLSIVQNHYPERLGRAFIIHVPWVIQGFFKLILPFVDPVTRVKIFFNPEVVPQGLIAADQVTKEWGGTIDFIYEHEQYWPALNSLCEERRKAQMERFRELGAVVGLSEWDIKGGAKDYPGGDVEPKGQADAGPKAELEGGYNAITELEVGTELKVEAEPGVATEMSPTVAAA